MKHGKDKAKHALTVLARRSRDANVRARLESLLRKRLRRLAPTAIETALETGGGLDEILAKLVPAQNDPLWTEELLSRIPSESTSLLRFDLAGTRQVLEHYRNAKDMSEEVRQRGVGTLANALAILLGDLGEHDEALSCAEESVAQFRRLTTGEFIEASLPTALNTYANELLAAGRWSEAVSVSVEAIGYAKVLSRVEPELLPDLAMVYTTCSDALAKAGRLKGAIRAMNRAVRVCRQLEQAIASSSGASLLSSLLNHGVLCNTADQFALALPSLTEAIAICRRFERDDVAVNFHFLASCLNNLAVTYSGLKQPQEAVEHSNEAIRILRELSMRSPEVHKRDLAFSLANHARALHETDQDAEAGAVLDDAELLLRELLRDAPGYHRLELANFLKNRAIVHERANDLTTALKCVAEAFELAMTEFFRRKDTVAPHLREISVLGRRLCEAVGTDFNAWIAKAIHSQPHQTDQAHEVVSASLHSGSH